jgi:hypothetical protein
MRFSLIRAGVVCAASTLALAACGGHGVVPSSQSPFGPQGAAAPIAQGDALSPDAVTKCDTSPPQYQWVFEGACAKIILKPSGGKFSLQKFNSITITGSIGDNNVKGQAVVYLADATGKGDIKLNKGKSFPKYNAKGTTFVYAVAVNQSNTNILPKPAKGKPILQYVITDDKGLPGKQCSAAVLTNNRGKLTWTGLPIQAPVKGKTVTLTQYSAPKGVQLGPKTPLYFAANCYS